MQDILDTTVLELLDNHFPPHVNVLEATRMDQGSRLLIKTENLEGDVEIVEVSVRSIGLAKTLKAGDFDTISME